MITDEHPEGILVDVSRPHLLLTERAATRGEGVFESLLHRHGRVRGLEDHLARLEASAAALALTIPCRDAWRAAIATALEAALPVPSGPDVEAGIKLVASRGPETAAPGTGTAWVMVTPVHRTTPHGPDNGLSVSTLDRGYPAGLAAEAPWLLIGVKSLSYAVNLAARRHARDHGADDAVFVSSDGFVLEGALSSVITAHRDADSVVTLSTPAAEAGLLVGTTQAAAFRAAARFGWRTRQARLTRQDLLTADAVWLVSSVRLAAAVTRVDGTRIDCDEELHRQLNEGLDLEL